MAKSAEISKIREYNSRNENEKIGELKLEKERMQREMNEMKYTIDIIRKQNIEFLSSNSSANLKNIDSIASEKKQTKKLLPYQLN